MIAAVTVPSGPFEVAFFCVFAVASIVGALGVVIAKDPFISALSLIVNLGALGTLYLDLHAPFVAVAQVLVYAGAVVVLFLFVIAYLGERRSLGSPGQQRGRWVAPLGVATALLFAGCVIWVATEGFGWNELPPFPGHIARSFGSVPAIARSFLTLDGVEFEATSIVLLVAAIGGVVLGLTGRARHNRLRRELGTYSADQRKRRYAREDPSGARYEQHRAAGDISEHGAHPGEKGTA